MKAVKLTSRKMASKRSKSVIRVDMTDKSPVMDRVGLNGQCGGWGAVKQVAARGGSAIFSRNLAMVLRAGCFLGLLPKIPKAVGPG